MRNLSEWVVKFETKNIESKGDFNEEKGRDTKRDMRKDFEPFGTLRTFRSAVRG